MKIDASFVKERWRAVLAWIAIGSGAVALVVGWFGVSAQTIAAKQLPYVISGGLGGIALVGAGVGLLVAEDLRAERVRTGRLEAELLEVRDLLRVLVDDRGARDRLEA
ncbi:MAG: hypothetical protein ACREQJ_14925 [Candidatus Binatia bacterium]